MYGRASIVIHERLGEEGWIGLRGPSAYAVREAKVGLGVSGSSAETLSSISVDCREGHPQVDPSMLLVMRRQENESAEDTHIPSPIYQPKEILSGPPPPHCLLHLLCPPTLDSAD
jgi:hypothetical protein